MNHIYTHPEMMMGMVMFGVFCLFTVFVLFHACVVEGGNE